MPSGTAATAYDPAGRLQQIGAAVTTQLLYDGDAPIAEYNANSGAIVNRYVPGPGSDETVTAYDSGGAKSWYHADAQGSVVATSDAGGSIVVVNQYGPYGEPGLVYQGRNQGRIRYTGQLYLPELAPWSGPAQPLMSYKARIYAPKLGRFLQTDPIGAADDRNLYAYVRNDPLNATDPSGLLADGWSTKSSTSSAFMAPAFAGTLEGLGSIAGRGALATLGTIGASVGGVALALWPTQLGMDDCAPPRCGNQYVVRGGVPSAINIRNSTGSSINGYGFSVQTAPDVSVNELARGLPFVPNQIGVSTTAQLQIIPGVAVRSPTPGSGTYHGTVNIPNPSPSSTFDLLSKSFQQTPNPVRPPR